MLCTRQMKWNFSLATGRRHTIFKKNFIGGRRNFPHHIRVITLVQALPDTITTVTIRRNPFTQEQRRRVNGHFRGDADEFNRKRNEIFRARLNKIAWKQQQRIRRLKELGIIHDDERELILLPFSSLRAASSILLAFSCSWTTFSFATIDSGSASWDPHQGDAQMKKISGALQQIAGQKRKESNDVCHERKRKRRSEPQAKLRHGSDSNQQDWVHCTASPSQCCQI